MISFFIVIYNNILLYLYITLKLSLSLFSFLNKKVKMHIIFPFQYLLFLFFLLDSLLLVVHSGIPNSRNKATEISLICDGR